jgi:hypothetical protein
MTYPTPDHEELIARLERDARKLTEARALLERMLECESLGGNATLEKEIENFLEAISRET